MSKWMYVFAATGLVCLVVFVLFSLPIPRQTSTIPFTLEDGTTGAATIIAPETLQQGNWVEIELDVTFDAAVSPDQIVKIKTNLQSTGLEVSPAGEVSAVIPVEGIAPFRWRIRSISSGEQRATMWCFRLDANGQSLILARELEFEVKSFMGITFTFARWILGTVFIVCVFALLRNIFRRKTGRFQHS